MFNPQIGEIPWRREQLPTPVFLPGKCHGQRSLAGYSPWGHKESDMTERLSLTFTSSSSFFFFFAIVDFFSLNTAVSFLLLFFPNVCFYYFNFSLAFILYYSFLYCCCLLLFVFFPSAWLAKA